MAKYEVLREIFNQCSGNQMRDIYVEEVDIDTEEGQLFSERTEELDEN